MDHSGTSRSPTTEAQTIGILFTVVLVFTACTPAPYWIDESSPPPACLPERLPTWSDYVKRPERTENAAAETAMQFGMIPGHSYPRLQVRFDPHRSWVFAALADPSTPDQWRRSEQLLAHEQLHYLIGCLLVRQANQVLAKRNGSVRDMLWLVKATAQRLNAQYDADTRHGLDREAQNAWIEEVMTQFAEVSSSESGQE